MNILLLGGAGFLGTNLAESLARNSKDRITVVDAKKEFFHLKKGNVIFKESQLNSNTDFEKLINDHEIIYHLVSTTVPTTSNQHILEELDANVLMTAKLLDACVKTGTKKIVFISSGGTVYGKSSNCPLSETMETNPITSYGVQKLTIEKLLYLYYEMYGLDYRIIRMANPYGPYQRPNGLLGVVTTFVYKALKDEEIVVYGDGSIIRDFIYIEDAITAMIKITFGEHKDKLYNLGSGYGTSINQVIKTIESCLNKSLNVSYIPGRKVDVPINFLDMTRYERNFGLLKGLTLNEGVLKTSDFMSEYYGI
ncbi:NAD-dependent epimerase/dehydratase family protein [Enterococcus casseliflavus]|uniref:NAD-dependent epimerase/dehydratase family protein n=1 Tax=Enterococcus casseliflavus TaxID=37734 RepID=UPI0035E091C8